jgi:hypothetical protein
MGVVENWVVSCGSVVSVGWKKHVPVTMSFG